MSKELPPLPPPDPAAKQGFMDFGKRSPATQTDMIRTVLHGFADECERYGFDRGVLAKLRSIIKSHYPRPPRSF